MNSEKTLLLRPHHGLCIQFFQGNGYSEEFVENMQGIVDALQKNPSVTLVSGADEVCRCCPNLMGERNCNAQEKVTAYDNAVLDLCLLQIGDSLRWEDFTATVKENILEKNIRTSVCGDCQWTEMCSRVNVKL